MANGWATIADRIRQVVFGETDPRLRATWRVLLAMPLLWMLTQDALPILVLGTVDAFPSLETPIGRLSVGLLRGVFFVIVLVLWARYIDRESLSNYGVSVSGPWLKRLLLGFVAVVLAIVLWVALAVSAGWMTIELVLSTTQGSFAVGMVFLLVTLAFSVIMQQITFFRVILKNAAEGLFSRGVAPPRAVIGGVMVAVVFFAGMHNLPSGLKALDLVVVGLTYGLLYAHTGDLALPAGVHLGIFYAGNTLFVSSIEALPGPVVFLKTASLSGVLGVIDGYGFPKILLAYLLLVAWLRFRQGEVPIERRIARCSG